MLTKAVIASAALAWAPFALALPQIVVSDDPIPATAVPPPGPPPPVKSPSASVTSHGPYTGPPATTTGALSTAVLAATIPALPANPTAYTYPSDGQLHAAEPAPYTPAGGLGTNGTLPVYNVKSDFDYESIVSWQFCFYDLVTNLEKALGLYQEYIELDLFHDGLARFSVADFEAAGLTASDRFLIEFMADQEVGHATLLSNILGAEAPNQCTYNYPYTTVREFIDFCQKLTRFGESGVYGFINHLDSREAAQLLLQSITTEARQQMIFRQFDGLFPMPVWFETGIPQSWAWTLLAPYISSCPANQTRLIWQNFPQLTVVNQPNPARVNANMTKNYETAGKTASAPFNETAVPSPDSCLNSTIVGEDCSPAITQNRSIPLSFPGREVFFEWENPGKFVGPNNSYVTAAGGEADTPRFVAWVTQLNLTYSPLTLTGPNTGSTFQPNVSTFAGDPAINGTMFVALTSTDLFLTPFNLSMINPF
ncbi:MAG: hypothetical protein LQ347_006374, partial [Umbilicaria vellea]